MKLNNKPAFLELSPRLPTSNNEEREAMRAVSLEPWWREAGTHTKQAAWKGLSIEARRPGSHGGGEARPRMPPARGPTHPQCRQAPPQNACPALV